MVARTMSDACLMDGLVGFDDGMSAISSLELTDLSDSGLKMLLSQFDSISSRMAYLKNGVQRELSARATKGG
jgi:hypothetical protein